MNQKTSNNLKSRAENDEQCLEKASNREVCIELSGYFIVCQHIVQNYNSIPCCTCYSIIMYEYFSLKILRNFLMAAAEFFF